MKIHDLVNFFAHAARKFLRNFKIWQTWDFVDVILALFIAQVLAVENRLADLAKCFRSIFKNFASIFFFYEKFCNQAKSQEKISQILVFPRKKQWNLSIFGILSKFDKLQLILTIKLQKLEIWYFSPYRFCQLHQK